MVFRQVNDCLLKWLKQICSWLKSLSIISDIFYTLPDKFIISQCRSTKFCYNSHVFDLQKMNWNFLVERIDLKTDREYNVNKSPHLQFVGVYRYGAGISNWWAHGPLNTSPTRTSSNIFSDTACQKRNIIHCRSDVSVILAPFKERSNILTFSYLPGP